MNYDDKKLIFGKDEHLQGKRIKLNSSKSLKVKRNYEGSLVVNRYDYAKKSNHQYNDIVKLTYKSSSGGFMKANLNYITKEDKAKQCFSSEKEDIDLDKENLEKAKNKFSRYLEDEKVFFKLVLSPEYKGTNLKKHTKEVIRYIEGVQQQKLIWFASEHKDTDDPHIHIIIRGIDQEGEEVRFSKELIKNGIRNFAKKDIERKYGQMSTFKLLRKMESQLDKDNISKIDRQIEYKIKKSGTSLLNGYINYYPKNEIEDERLKYLGKYGLTKPFFYNDKKGYKLKSNFIKELKIIQERANSIEETKKKKLERGKK